MTETEGELFADEVLRDSSGDWSISRLVAEVRADQRAHGENLSRWARPGLHAAIVYRFGRWQRHLRSPIRWPLAILYGLLYWTVRVLYLIELPAQADVGSGLVIGHQGGVVISHHARIGERCRIRHNVTIGGKRHARDVPWIGNDVSIAPGAVLIGAIVVGDGAVIGPNTVVMTDVPPGARVMPPRPAIRLPGRAVGTDSGIRESEVRDDDAQRTSNVGAEEVQGPEES